MLHVSCHRCDLAVLRHQGCCITKCYQHHTASSLVFWVTANILVGAWVTQVIAPTPEQVQAPACMERPQGGRQAFSRLAATPSLPFQPGVLSKEHRVLTGARELRVVLMFCTESCTKGKWQSKWRWEEVATTTAPARQPAGSDMLSLSRDPLLLMGLQASLPSITAWVAPSFTAPGQLEGRTGPRQPEPA